MLIHRLPASRSRSRRISAGLLVVGNVKRDDFFKCMSSSLTVYDISFHILEITGGNNE